MLQGISRHCSQDQRKMGKLQGGSGGVLAGSALGLVAVPLQSSAVVAGQLGESISQFEGKAPTVKLQPVQKALVPFGLSKVLPFHGDLPRRFFVSQNNTIQYVSIRCAKISLRMNMVHVGKSAAIWPQSSKVLKK